MITPNTGYSVIAGYFAGDDYADVNPSAYTSYSNMELEQIGDPNPSTGAVTYRFTASEWAESDTDYNYIYLYFHCAKLPQNQWPSFIQRSGSATAPSPDGSVAAVPFTDNKPFCADSGYFNGVASEDEPYLQWDYSCTDGSGKKAGGTVSIVDNVFTYTPTADEAGKTITIKIWPSFGAVSGESSPMTFTVQVKKPTVNQYTVSTNVDGNGVLYAYPYYNVTAGTKIQIYGWAMDGHHLSSFTTTPGNLAIDSDNAFIMPSQNVELKAKFEPHTPEEDDGDCTTPIHCTFCDEVVTEGKESHEFDWVSNGDGTHTGSCTNEGCKQTSTENCTFEDGVCTVCGAEQPVTSEPEEEEIYIPSTSISDGWKYYSIGTMYYQDGKRVRGWVDIDGSHYYFDAKGIMVTGWKEIAPDSGNWYHFGTDGVLDHGWYKEGNAWYYLDPETGLMYNDGLATIGKSAYYFYDWGGMASDWWYEAEDGWYFFGGSGAMKSAQWLEWEGDWYYLTETGRMAVDTEVGGYYLNAEGVWVE